MTVAPATPLLGGRYALGSVLGRGGMADVHRATDTVLGRDVAVKVFKPFVEDVDRTSSEVELLASLDHPGLVSLYDAGTAEDGAPWIVMQLVDGPTLRECCLDGSLPAERVAAVGADLADALAHCHERGVIHRDIKPANVLLGADGRPRLADFGIARLVDAARHTATGLTVGTAPYFSPEQVRGRAVGPPSDVYSLGLVLLEALTGVREYPETDPVACAVARLHRAPVIPGSLAPGADGRAWSWLLTRMTADDPGDRPTAAEAAAELGALAGRGGRGAVAAPLPVDATRVLTMAVPVEPAAPADTAAPASPGATADTVTVAHLQAPAAPPRPDPVRTWLRGVRRSLVDDPAGLVMALAVAAVLLVLVAVAAVAAVGGGDEPAAPAKVDPIERLEESVRR